jgi:hypothetical protein
LTEVENNETAARMTRKVAAMVASLVKGEEFQLKTHPVRWCLLTAGMIALAGMFPVFSGAWPFASGVCVVAALFRLAVLIYLWRSGRLRGQRG